MAVGRSVPDLVGRMPPRQRRLVLTGAGLGSLAVLYGLGLAAHALIGPEPVDWSWPIRSVVLPAILAFSIGLLVAWSQQRRMGGGDVQREFDAAVRSRRLPDDADPAVWGPVLAGEQRFVRRVFTVVPLATAGLVAVVVGLAAVTVEDVRVEYLGISAALFAAMVLMLHFVGHRQQRRLADLAAQLPAGGGQSGR